MLRLEVDKVSQSSLMCRVARLHSLSDSGE